MTAKPAVEQQDMSVQNGRLVVNFLSPDFDTDKDGKTIGLRCSMMLTDAHKGKLPDKVEDAWAYLKKSGNKRVDILEVEPQSIEFYTDPTNPDELIQIIGGGLAPVRVEVVELTGDGEAKDAYRVTFTVWSIYSEELRDFATEKYDSQLWMKMAARQGKLI